MITQNTRIQMLLFVLFGSSVVYNMYTYMYDFSRGTFVSANIIRDSIHNYYYIQLYIYY